MADDEALFTFLGTDTSTGVPMAGCDCRVCRSPDIVDKRHRSSAVVSHKGKNVVIDTGPEFRVQALCAGLDNVAAVLVTHDHADHLHGLDDIRAYSLFKNTEVPVWGSAATLATVRHRFGYIWNAPQVGGGLPAITLHEADKPFRAGGMVFIPVPIFHGTLPILGYRVGDLAYLTDVSSIPDSSFRLIDNIETLIVSAVRMENHPTHMSIPETIELHERLRPRRTFLTHLTHSFTHRELGERLPSGMAPAYDGLQIKVRLT
ncbi:MAG: MBL fold metallo-hydrolase [Planctomycetaceae bacterium]|nr:MBL fold metallo-hydrolase [Planctomycetaceae bacterium]